MVVSPSPVANLASTRQMLRELACASHWNPMLGSDEAVGCKLRRSQYVLDQLNGARQILDYGSGMGFLACYMATRVDEVVGVEIVEEWRDTSYELARRVFQVDNVRFVDSDDELEPDSFDAVTFCNSVSHIAHLTHVFWRIRELLRPGGILFIEDNNNRQSVVVKRRQPKVWRSADAGYAKVRAQLDPGREEETYGLGRGEILDWRGRDLTPLRRLREFAPRSPRDGSYDENWFTTHELEVLLFNTGFAPLDRRAKHVFDFKTRTLASTVFRTMPRLSLFVAPAFEVTAVRV